MGVIQSQLEIINAEDDNRKIGEALNDNSLFANDISEIVELSNRDKKVAALREYVADRASKLSGKKLLYVCKYFNQFSNIGTYEGFVVEGLFELMKRDRDMARRIMNIYLTNNISTTKLFEGGEKLEKFTEAVDMSYKTKTEIDSDEEADELTDTEQILLKCHFIRKLANAEMDTLLQMALYFDFWVEMDPLRWHILSMTRLLEMLDTQEKTCVVKISNGLTFNGKIGHKMKRLCSEISILQR